MACIICCAILATFFSKSNASWNPRLTSLELCLNSLRFNNVQTSFIDYIFITLWKGSEDSLNSLTQCLLVSSPHPFSLKNLLGSVITNS